MNRKISFKAFLKNRTTLQKVILFTIAFLLIAYIFCLPRKLFQLPYSTVVTDRKGELLGARIADDEQWRFPPCDSLPEKFKICITQFEDQYFRYHWGVNPLAIARALKQNLQEKRVVSGASTLTMQTIRLARNKKRTVLEKTLEAILATRLEFRYSKDKILALYASHAPFGGNVVGIDAAAWRYFGHSAELLSWAESATLAVLPNAPAMLHLSKNRPALLQKRNRLLKTLFEKDIIDQSTYELALSEDLPDEPLPLPQIAPHLVDRLNKSNHGAYLVSSIDKSKQLRCESILERWNREFMQSNIMNLAAIVIDTRSNEMLVYCGNVNFSDKNTGNQVDVIQADRSTGSILKPFLFEAMLQEGEILPQSLVPDVPLNINGFSPQNFSRQYEGAVPAANAVARSLNVPLVAMLRDYGVPKFYDFLKQNKIADLPRPPSHYGLSLVLGGAEARLGDVATAYSNMARSLLNLKSSSYSILLNEKKATFKTAFDKASAWLVLDALTEVNRPEEIDWRSIPSMQRIAWKTGTSYGFRDAWAVGVTSDFVVGVWAGNASGEGVPNLIGARTAGAVMFDIFESLPSSRWFDLPYSEFVEAEICRESGCLKGRFCEHTDTVLILPKGLHSEVCPYHIQVNLTPDEKYRIYENCLDEEASVQKSWFVLPPAWAWYYRQHHPDYASLPAFKRGCKGSGEQAMQFIYPQDVFTQIKIPLQLDGSQGKITFELAHNNRNAVVFWHIDSDYIASTSDIHQINVLLRAGKHSITAVDDEGNTISCTVEVL